MSLIGITAESLSETLGQDVPSNYVIVAKHSVMGIGEGQIAEILGVPESDVVELTEDPLYTNVRAVVAVAQADMLQNQTASWDALESSMLQKLIERAPFEKDSDFLLRAAAVANRAKRKLDNESQVLTPQDREGKTAITLTERLVRRITSKGVREEDSIRTLSIEDGTMERCNFEEVDSLLNGVEGGPANLIEEVTDV